VKLCYMVAGLSMFNLSLIGILWGAWGVDELYLMDRNYLRTFFLACVLLFVFFCGAVPCFFVGRAAGWLGDWVVGWVGGWLVGG